MLVGFWVDYALIVFWRLVFFFVKFILPTVVALFFFSRRVCCYLVSHSFGFGSQLRRLIVSLRALARTTAF